MSIKTSNNNKNFAIVMSSILIFAFLIVSSLINGFSFDANWNKVAYGDGMKNAEIDTESYIQQAHAAFCPSSRPNCVDSKNGTSNTKENTPSIGEGEQQQLTSTNNTKVFDRDISNAFIIGGNKLFDEYRYAEAISKYESSIHWNPNNAIAYINKGIALDRLRNYSGAIGEFDKAIAIDPQYRDAYYSKGITLHHLGDYNGELAQYNKVIALDSNYTPAYMGKGSTLFDRQRYSEAIINFKKVIEVNPQNVDVLNNIGYALYKLDRFNESVDYFDRVLAIDPSNDYALDTKTKITALIDSSSNSTTSSDNSDITDNSGSSNSGCDDNCQSQKEFDNENTLRNGMNGANIRGNMAPQLTPILP